MTVPEDELQRGLAELDMGVACQSQGDNQAARDHYGTAIGSGHPEAGLLARFNLAKIGEVEGGPSTTSKKSWICRNHTPGRRHGLPTTSPSFFGNRSKLGCQGRPTCSRLQPGEQHGNVEVVAKAEEALSAFPG